MERFNQGILEPGAVCLVVQAKNGENVGRIATLVAKVDNPNSNVRISYPDWWSTEEEFVLSTVVNIKSGVTGRIIDKKETRRASNFIRGWCLMRIDGDHVLEGMQENEASHAE